jgi:PAS domain S-box-containing protein
MEKEKKITDRLRPGQLTEKPLKAAPGYFEDLAGMSPKELVALIHDLHVHQIELKMQNDELQRLHQELENTRDQYAHLYNFSPVGYFTLSEEGIIDEANLKIASMFDVERSALIGMPFGRFISRDDQDIFYKNRQRLLETGSSQSFELRLLKKDGHEFHASLECMVVKKPDADSKNIRVAASDISERKRSEKEKKQLETQLRLAQKMQALGTLAGGIAHEFNNILGIILGNTELAVDDVPEWNPARFNLEEIRTASLRAKVIVHELLSFVRKTESERKPIKINAIVTGSLKLIRSSIPSNIKVRQDIQKESQSILADPTQINQVMIDLITNAVHAMEKDGGVLRIGLNRVTLDDGTARHLDLSPGFYVKLTVSDTGHGIDPEIVDRIFDPYFTTKKIGKGSGMGLAVVKGIIRNHDGAISVDSGFEKGTAFNIFLPAIEDEPAPVAAINEDFKTGKEKILFVDDEESLVEIVTQILERLGYQVEATTNPFEALEIFSANSDKFDLVITDLTMPGMTGDKLVKEILAIRPEMPIILCSGFSDQVDGGKAKELGIRAFIMKPVVIRKMAGTIRTVLDQN